MPLFARLLADAGREAGVAVELLRYPAKRCPTQQNLAEAGWAAIGRLRDAALQTSR